MKDTNGTFFNRDNVAGIKFHIDWLGKAFLDINTKPTSNQRKNKQIELIKIKNLYVKGHCKDTEKTTHRMAENPLKSRI